MTVSSCVIWSRACDLGDGEVRAGGEVEVQCDLAAKLEWRCQANAGRGCGAFVVKQIPPTLVTAQTAGVTAFELHAKRRSGLFPTYILAP
jgi:hypothetical protein